MINLIENSAAATGGSTNGMGAVSLPNGDSTGSGDILVNLKKKKKKKKMRKFSEVYDELEEQRTKLSSIGDSVDLLQEIWSNLKSMYNLSGSRSTILLDELEDIKYDTDTLEVEQKSLKVIAKLLNTNTVDLSTELSGMLNDYLVESIEFTDEQIEALTECILNNTMNESVLDEGILGSVLGGLGGLAFGKSIGKLIAKVLGIKENSPFYNVLTSRLVGTAIGASIGGGGKKK